MSLNVRFADLETVIDAEAAIDEVTGELSSAFDVGKTGCYNLNIELDIVATAGGNANLLWELRPTVDGTNFTNAVRSGTIANVITTAEKVVLEIKDFMFLQAKLYVASDHVTETWTVTAKVQLLKVHDTAQGYTA